MSHGQLILSPSTWILLAISLIALVGMTIAKAYSRRSAYKRKPFLLSPAERSFFGVLEEAIGHEYRIFPKIRVADVLQVAVTRENKGWQSAQNRINSKHFDFVLCSRDDVGIAAAVELDDASHFQKRRMERDAFLNQACAGAGLPLIRIKARSTYSTGEVRNAMLSGLDGSTRNVPQNAVAYSNGGATIEKGPSAHDNAAPNCPQCRTPMVRRVARRGESSGQPFWGCSNYPNCKQIREI